MEIFYLIILAIAGILLGSIALGTISLAPWVPSRKKDLKRIFKLAEVKPGEVFYDLGCGTGQVVMYANKQFGAKSVGIELGLPMYLICLFKKLFIGNKNIQFKWKNFFKIDLGQADIVYLFGLPGTLKQKLKEKLTNDLKTGSRVISYIFPIDGWHPVKTDGDGEKQAKIYLYVL